MSNTVIALKKSATPTRAPTNLANGELAINYADGILYYKAANGTIASIQSLEGNSFGTVNANGTFVVSDTVGDILTIVPGNNISIIGDAINDKITVGLKDDVVIRGDFYVNNSPGAGGNDEGGEIHLANATTNSVLNGYVVVDIYQNKIRFFEAGSPNRGAFINLAAAATSVGTDLLAASSGTDAYARTTANQAFDKANAALPNVSGTWFNGTLNASANLAADKIISNNNGNGENFKVGDDAWIGDYNAANSIRIKGQQNTQIAYINFGTGDTKSLGRDGTGPLTYDGQTVWHAGNDGTGSGLDADLLDGQHGSYYGIASDVTAAFVLANTGFAKANTANITADRAWNHANAAFDTANIAFANANTIMVSAQAAFTVANASFLHANAAYAFANSITITANLAFAHANAAFANGNTVIQTAQSAFTQANLAFIHANNAFASANAGQASGNAGQSTANASYAFANSAHAIANLAFTHANNAYNKANTANITADRAWNHANAAFDTANNALPKAGGTVTGNLAVTGSLTIQGNVYMQDTETVKISDPLLYLAGNNYSSDIVDIGFVANYVNATGQNVHTGIFRDATIKEYYFFEGYDKEPNPNHIDTAGNNFTISVLNATVKTSNLILGGVNAIATIGASFNHANAAHASANAGMATANVALARSNTLFITANGAWDKANTANITADRAWNHANAAFLVANNALPSSSYTAADVLSKLLTVDGAASGLDADLLDNQHGSYYGIATDVTAANRVANAAFLHANASYAFANSAHAATNAAFLSANTARTVVNDTISATRYLMFANGTTGTASLNVAVGLSFNPSSNTLNINGPINAVTKSFVITHPTKDGMTLRYGSLEGPENGVYVRGRVQGPYIYLPDYWFGLVDENSITVSLTPIAKTEMPSVLSYNNQKVVIHSNTTIDCFYHIFGERKDVDKLVVEY